MVRLVRLLRLCVEAFQPIPKDWREALPDEAPTIVRRPMGQFVERPGPRGLLRRKGSPAASEAYHHNAQTGTGSGGRDRRSPLRGIERAGDLAKGLGGRTSGRPGRDACRPPCSGRRRTGRGHRLGAGIGHRRGAPPVQLAGGPYVALLAQARQRGPAPAQSRHSAETPGPVAHPRIGPPRFPLDLHDGRPAGGLFPGAPGQRGTAQRPFRLCILRKSTRNFSARAVSRNMPQARATD